jgi:protein tyrosine/serine phosphatase
MKIPRAYMWIAAIVVVAVLVGVYVWMFCFQTYHFAAVEPLVLYRDGFRTVREFQTAVADAKAKSVVSLLDRTEQGNEPFSFEDDFCRRSKIRFIWLPVKLGGWPTQKDVKDFLGAVENKNRQPVLVHCAQGVRRTGMMVAAYQMSVLKWDKDRTKKEILTFGHSRRSIGDVERFIDGYDPVTMATVSDLPVSVE